MIDQGLLVEFLRVYAFQPATAFWRAVEVVLLKNYVPSSGTCLDLGCGDGKLTSILFGGAVDAKISLVGIDGDADETRQAAQSPIYQRVHTCLASNVPEESGIFDTAISNSVLEHIQDIEQTIAEVARLLKTGASFVFTVPSPGFHRCLYGPLSPRTSREAYLQEMDRRLAHYRYLSLEEWRVLLARYGLLIEQHVEYFNCSEVQRWETISRFTGGILYNLGRRKHAPITVQKQLGLRSMQNRLTLPRGLAFLLAKLLSARLRAMDGQVENACYLIVAVKQAAS